MTYTVSRRTSSGEDVDTKFDTFGEALAAYKANASRFPLVAIFNADSCDYATDTGWNDGLTDEERDQL